jgi:hypothetical protein
VLSSDARYAAERYADHIGTLLLASWIEDNAGDDENEAIETLFETYLLPWVGTFLGKSKPRRLAILENAGTADPRRNCGDVG